jgi:hypothetical protein
VFHFHNQWSEIEAKNFVSGWLKGEHLGAAGYVKLKIPIHTTRQLNASIQVQVMHHADATFLRTSLGDSDKAGYCRGRTSSKLRAS